MDGNHHSNHGNHVNHHGNHGNHHGNHGIHHGNHGNHHGNHFNPHGNHDDGGTEVIKRIEDLSISRNKIISNSTQKVSSRVLTYHCDSGL